MSYRDFDLRTVKQQLGVHLIERQGVFAAVPAVAMRAEFAELLAETVPLARGINTEKARSELIIAPMLVELRKQLQHRISLFSGIEFNVDKQHGLNGFCDFIISASPQQLMLNAPVIVIVEAKNENIISELGQCIAEMIAADCFNNAEHRSIPTLYGVVTTGTAWKFLTLEQSTVVIDLDEYMIDQPGKILGILQYMLAASVAPNAA